MEPPDGTELSQVLAQIAGALLVEQTLEADLQRVARLAMKLVPECSAASIALLAEGQPTTTAVTDRVALELDLVQYDTGEGPCLLALGGQVVRVGFLPGDERFPHFAVGAADARVLSVLSTPLIDHGTVVGTLNMYATREDAFGEGAVDLALVVATEAATAVVGSALYARAMAIRRRLQEAHDEKAVVAMAQGYLMGVDEITGAQAMALLHHASDSNEERLVDAAHRVLEAARDQRAAGGSSEPPGA